LNYPVGVAETFPRSRRLAHDLEYQAVYGARVKKSLGPLTAFARPNTRPFHRLGLSIRRFEKAVTRNRLKRHLREAFRLEQDGLPMLESGGYDLVFTARDHDELALTEYRRLVRELAAQLDREWRRRG
jgi:ribonuclease P protein component